MKRSRYNSEADHVRAVAFVVAALAFPQAALAGISVSGNIASNTTWALADSPITV